MRKIKNFKVSLRVNEVLKKVKNNNNISESALELEKTVKHAFSICTKFIHPSVVYDTFSKQCLPLAHEASSLLPGYVACSVFCITLGNDIEKKYKLNVFGVDDVEVVQSVAIYALEQAKAFVYKLIANEAKEESCEILKTDGVSSSFYSELVEKIPIEKIDVDMLSGELRPKYSASGLLFWVPFKKKQKKRISRLHKNFL